MFWKYIKKLKCFTCMIPAVIASALCVEPKQGTLIIGSIEEFQSKTKENPQLTSLTLYLDYKQIGDKGVIITIGEGLSNLTELTSLSLGLTLNQIKEKGGNTILSSLSNLQYLSSGWVSLFDFKADETIDGLIKNNKKLLKQRKLIAYLYLPAFNRQKENPTDAFLKKGFVERSMRKINYYPVPIAKNVLSFL